MAPRSREALRVDELGTSNNADAGTTQAAGRVPLEMPEPVPEKAEEHEEKTELPNTGKPASVLAPTETTQRKARGRQDVGDFIFTSDSVAARIAICL